MDHPASSHPGMKGKVYRRSGGRQGGNARNLALAMPGQLVYAAKECRQGIISHLISGPPLVPNALLEGRQLDCIVPGLLPVVQAPVHVANVHVKSMEDGLGADARPGRGGSG